MKNKKKLGKMIALALVLGSCSASLTEASDIGIFGNSAPNYKNYPGEGSNASGYTLDYDSSFNTINPNGLSVFGGYGRNIDASFNTLNFNSGSVHGAFAGYVEGFGNANHNTVNINDGIIKNHVFGGFTDNGNANNNTVNINGGEFSILGAVFGGQSSAGDANNNTVNIHSDMNDCGIWAGFAHDGNSNNNTVYVTTGSDKIYKVNAGSTGSSTIVSDYTVNNNNIIVDTNANIGWLSAGAVYFSDGTYIPYKISSNDNKVIIYDGNIYMIEASSILIKSNNADDKSYIRALDNSVEFNNGKANFISVVSIGDFNNDGASNVNKKTPITISGNHLIIKGGEVEFAEAVSVHKVIAEAVAVDKVIASDLTVKDNRIDIDGGVVNHINAGRFGLDELSTIQSANNTVNWYSGDIHGNINGYTYSTESSSHYNGMPLSGSTFNFYASSRKGNYNKNISSLGGFENYHFYLDNTIPANTTLINLGYADLTGANIGVAVLGSSPLQQGDSVTLLDATNSAGSIMTSSNLSNNTSHMTAENISTVYDFTLENQDNKKLIATVSGSGSNHKSENLMAVRSAEAFMTYDKVDVVDKAYQASKHTSEPTSFIEYGYSDVTTKDDTKLRGSNVLWGIASTIGGEKDQANTLTRGLFFEYGDGTFSSIGHYPTGSIYGYGKSKKLGLGVLLRKVMFDRHYYDAYLRAGTIKTDYDAFADGVGNINYENRDMYVSGNLGYGQLIQLTPKLQMDTYIKYFYNRIPGHSTTAYTNGVDAMPISFDVFENHRFRLGSKFTWDYMESNNYKWYADVALEQEFARDQSGSINSHRISKSNGSSTTGVIELCYENKFGANDAFMFTAKAQGYVGDRRGLGASANLSFSF